MEMYLLKSAACLAVLLLFYKLLLERENMHIFKRFYLLISVLAAFVIPLITFTSYVEPASENFNTLIFSSESSSEVAAEKIDLSYIFFGIYLLGVLFFSIKFFRNLRSLILKIKTNPKVKTSKFINVLLSEKVQPHTFFSFIFFNKENYLQDKIPQDVKIHEEAHARQKHSLDVLFIELLQIIFWFNPLIFLLKDAVKLNHEFLADKEVIKKGISTYGYQQTLLAYSSGDLQSDLVNPINYSSIKKRFTVMKTKTSGTSFWVRSLLVLPLMALLVYGFSTKEMILKEDLQESVDTTKILIVEDINISIYKDGSIMLNNKSVAVKNLNDRLAQITAGLTKEEKDEIQLAEIKVESGVKMGLITDVKSVLMKLGLSKIKIFIAEKPALASENNRQQMRENLKDLQLLNDDQDIASAEMVAEYNKLVKYYNSLPKDKRSVKQKDANKIMAIFSRMTSEQKSKAEKIKFDVPPPPPPAPAPKPEKNIGNVPVPPVPTVPLSGDGNTQPPPPPAPPAFEDLVEKGATFYYEFKEISPEEARKLVEVDKKVNVQITKTNGKSVVRLLDKEE